ncbi:hypothetical protein BH10PSE16_BH10PSE16_17130 [soil metagenome]
MAPKFVTPYRLSGKKGKNDAADAQAICEAVGRPTIRFVPVKTLDQQGQLLVHRARQGFVEQRTATLNRIRGLLSEFGVVLPLSLAPALRLLAARLAWESDRQAQRAGVQVPDASKTTPDLIAACAGTYCAGGLNGLNSGRCAASLPLHGALGDHYFSAKSASGAMNTCAGSYQ